MVVVDGSYDDAVRQSATLADSNRLVVSDTSWPEYEEVPGYVIEGYTTIFREIDEQAGDDGVDVAFIPIGVGALAAAAARHYVPRGVRLASVEPTDAACLLESVRAGEIVQVPGPHTSIMAGLNAGLPSMVAWPEVSGGFDVFAAVEDGAAVDGMRALAELGLRAGEVSGGTTGAARLLLDDLGAREALDADGDSTVIVLLTEGVTDPYAYERLIA